MQRIFLFLLTNIAIMVILSITLRVLGVESLLMQNGSDLNINSLVIFSGVFGFGGAFISLAISKWMAKRMTGATVISSPKNNIEKWLIETVEKQSEIVGIKVPEVAIFPSNQNQEYLPIHFLSQFLFYLVVSGGTILYRIEVPVQEYGILALFTIVWLLTVIAAKPLNRDYFKNK